MGDRQPGARLPGSPALRKICCAAAVCGALFAVPGDAWTQTALRAQCVAASRAQVRELCENVADATVILQPRIGLALTGGNAVPGTASTLGMRLGSMPRISMGVRVTAVSIELPPVARVGENRTLSFPVGGISADASVGIFSGVALLPTVGGFGSIDVLASAGLIPLPRGEGFDDGSAFSWAAGARLGVLRESFTAPGISVDVMYRSLADVAYGSADLSDRDAFINVDDYGVMSVRAVVGKRILGFGATAGAAYDRYSAGIHARIVDPVSSQPDAVLEIRESSLTTSRTSLFGNVSLTLLILNVAVEGGWQRGGSVPQGASDLIGNGALFGGIALRLAI